MNVPAIKTSSATASQPRVMPRRTYILLAAGCGFATANVYYAQALVEPIGSALSIPDHISGSIASMAQFGYALGLIALVPLSDLLENRSLLVALLIASTFAALGAAVAPNGATFLASIFVLGLCSIGVQLFMQYAVHLSPPERWGLVVGELSAALLLGAVLARFVAIATNELFGWRAVFLLAALFMVVLAALTRLEAPVRRPTGATNYGQLIRSMGALARNTPVLWRRGIYCAVVFCSFSLFWTAAPLHMHDEMKLSPTIIALFTLAGVASVLAAPFGGRVSNTGRRFNWTLATLIALGGCFAISTIAPSRPVEIASFVAAALLMSVAQPIHVVLSQREVLALGEAVRGRLNAMFMATFFFGGAVGSVLAGWAHAVGGWPLVCILGGAGPLVCAAYEARRLLAAR